uniref:Uncharacterized protein n=1 Tax=Anguilla anguilla TaxID=7936 RepID=A0A0E9UEF2_ANGAN
MNKTKASFYLTWSRVTPSFNVPCQCSPVNTQTPFFLITTEDEN